VVLNKDVLGSVPELQPGTSPRVTGIAVANQVSPLLGTLDGLALRTLTVPHAGASEAGVWDASEGSTSSEQIGVCTREDLGHHRTRRGSSDIDTTGIDVVVRDGEADGTRDTQGVTSRVVSEGRGAVDVPASSAVWGVRVDYDEALELVRKVGVLRAAEVRLRRTRAVVDSDHQSWSGDDIGRFIDEGTNPSRVAAEVEEFLDLVLSSQDANGVDETEGDVLEEEGGHVGDDFANPCRREVPNVQTLYPI